MTHLEEGMQAPPFKGPDQNNNLISLEEFKGSGVILFFYPKDNTPGCTAEACNLQENLDYWKNKGYSIIGISPDSVESHKKFSDKFGFEYTLVADPEKEILKAYGVYGPKKMYGRETIGVHRTTFILDKEGKVIKIFKRVKTKEHSEQIGKALDL